MRECPRNGNSGQQGRMLALNEGDRTAWRFTCKPHANTQAPPRSDMCRAALTARP